MAHFRELALHHTSSSTCGGDQQRTPCTNLPVLRSCSSGTQDTLHLRRRLYMLSSIPTHTPYPMALDYKKKKLTRPVKWFKAPPSPRQSWARRTGFLPPRYSKLRQVVRKSRNMRQEEFLPQIQGLAFLAQTDGCPGRMVLVPSSVRAIR